MVCAFFLLSISPGDSKARLIELCIEMHIFSLNTSFALLIKSICSHIYEISKTINIFCREVDNWFCQILFYGD